MTGYTELEETHKDCCIQLLAPCSTTQKVLILYLRVAANQFMNSEPKSHSHPYATALVFLELAAFTFLIGVASRRYPFQQSGIM